MTGTATNLQNGDRLLLVGRNDNNTPSVQTKVVIVRDVETQPSQNQTLVDLRDDLGESPSPPRFAPFRYRELAFTSQYARLNLDTVSVVSQRSITESDLGAYIAMNNWSRADVVRLATWYAPPRLGASSSESFGGASATGSGNLLPCVHACRNLRQ